MASFATPISYQEIQKALNQLQAKHEAHEKENEYLKKIINQGKIDQYVFESLYKGGNITVMSLTGGKFSINVYYTDRIEDIQQKIYNQEGIPMNSQRLIFGGRRLASHRTLYHYKIPVGGLIHIVMDLHPPCRPWMPRNKKDMHDDNYYIEQAVTKLISDRTLKKQMERVWRGIDSSLHTNSQ